MKHLASVLVFVFEILLWASISGAMPPSRNLHTVRLEVLSVKPVKDETGLSFEIQFRLLNSTRTAILIEILETEEKTKPQPYFVRYDKKLNYQPYWLFLGPFLDAPAETVLEVGAGKSIEFSETIGSVSAYRVPSKEGIPVRGVHRARLRYFLSQDAFNRARLHKKAEGFWAISDDFRIDWPAEFECKPLPTD